MQTFATEAPITAVLDVPAGRIQLVAADRADTTVEVRPTNASKESDVRAAEQTTVEYADGALRIAVPAKGRLFGPSGSVEVVVQLPAGSRVTAKSAAIEVRVVGRLGDVDIEGAYDRIKLDEVANLRLVAVEGDVEVGRLTGPAEITTTRGDIRIGEAVRGAVVLRTRSGGITIGAAAGTSATLDAGTSLGRIENTLKNDGTPGLTIHATTEHGDIVARSV